MSELRALERTDLLGRLAAAPDGSGIFEVIQVHGPFWDGEANDRWWWLQLSNQWWVQFYEQHHGVVTDPRAATAHLN